MQINLNRDRIAALGLTVNQVETALFNAYGTRQVSQIYASSNQYPVILQVAPEFQQDPAALSMLYVRSSNGKLIPLNTVASVTSGVGPLSVSHSGQLPSVNLSFNLKPGHALGDAVNAIEEAATDDTAINGHHEVPGRRRRRFRSRCRASAWCSSWRSS